MSSEHWGREKTIQVTSKDSCCSLPQLRKHEDKKGSQRAGPEVGASPRTCEEGEQLPGSNPVDEERPWQAAHRRMGSDGRAIQIGWADMPNPERR